MENTLKRAFINYKNQSLTFPLKRLTFELNGLPDDRLNKTT
jgi:hypothetical protein